MGNFLRVRAAELLIPGGALVAALAAIGLLVRARRRRALPGVVRRWAELAGALGDAVLVLDGAGRVVRVNDAAVSLTGTESLIGRSVASLGQDLAALVKGLARGPASAFVSVAGLPGEARAWASLARLSSRPPLDLVVLRPEPVAGPPPPRAEPAAGPAPAPEAAPDPGPARAGILVAAAAVREPLARASRAASLLRLVGPPLPRRADAALVALETALDDAEHRLLTVTSAAESGRGRPLDLALIVEDVVAAFAPPAGVRVRTRISPAIALADERPVRTALREMLRAAGAGGGVVDVAVSAAPGGATVEIAAAGEGDVGAALARALVAPHGGRVEEDEGPGGARMVRLVLVSAPEGALAPA